MREACFSVSSAGMMLFELAYFTDALLMRCLPCPPKWKVFILWKKMAKLGGFQKFLYYTLMSVVCFLHPVLVWHAVIPGTMLLVTGFAYFILSKQKKTPPKEPVSPLESCDDAPAAAASNGDAGDVERAYSFFRIITGKRASALSYFPSASNGEASKDSSQAMLEESRSADSLARKRDKRRVHFKEKALHAVQDETEMQEYQEMDQEETTSDKAPMIRP
ncbi:hypothetical protein MATL_G00185560 [Megalops atlanticus]|uniref:Transmembrane protein 72 n=1 Tax=Megalops atlanticus TaxID=7932 RepID=A0A9D3PP81_MEGAT|nr:hypothetical protein MATL_G00185560 [Megalops atlanticus]